MIINNQQFNQHSLFRWLDSNVTLGCQVAEVTHGCRVAKVTFLMGTLIAVLFTSSNDKDGDGKCVSLDTKATIFVSKKGLFCLQNMLLDFLVQQIT